MNLLSSEIKKYIERLRSEFPSITQIWLLGSRANGCARHDSDWDLLVFSSEPFCNEIRKREDFHRAAVDLLVVDDAGEFAKPFGSPKSGSLSSWQWHQVSNDLATYRGMRWVPGKEAEEEGMEGLGDLICETLRAVAV